MEWVSTWDHGKDPVAQFLPRWLSDMACSHAHTRITPFCLFGGDFYSSLKLLKELQVSVSPMLSVVKLYRESSLEEGHGQLLVSHLTQQGPCCVHNPEEFLKYNEINWKAILIIATSITQDITNQKVKLGWIGACFVSLKHWRTSQGDEISFSWMEMSDNTKYIPPGEFQSPLLCVPTWGQIGSPFGTWIGFRPLVQDLSKSNFNHVSDVLFIP